MKMAGEGARARTIQRWPLLLRGIFAFVLTRTADYEAARPLYERAISIWEGVARVQDHPKVATAQVNLARLYLGTGKPLLTARGAADPYNGD